MTSEELHNEIADLDDVIKTLRSEIEGLRKDENDVAFQIEKMEMERALMDTSLDNAREETSELVETNQALMQENAELNETMEEMQLAIEKLNTQLSKHREESDRYAQEITERETEIESVKYENLRIRKQLDQQMPTDQFSQPPKRSGNTKGATNLESELEDARSQLSHVHGLLEKFRIDKIHLENEIRRMQEDYHGHYHMALFSPKEPAIQEEGELSSSAREYGSELYSQRTLSEGHLPELSAEQLSAHLQEESLSLRSENEVLRSKIASLEGSITEMTERLVPKLELGSIADESDAKHKASHGNDDDTGRYVEDIDTTRASGTATVQKLEEKLHMSEEAGAKLLMQVQEMEEEANVLRSNLQDLSDQNNTLQKQFFGTISENFQTQVDELSLANASLKEVLQKKDENLDEVKEELSQISAAESQLRHRYKEVQGVAEELRQQLQQAETDNHDLQQRLLDLDDEYRNMMQHDEGQEKNPGYDDMKQMTSDVSAQTLSIGELLQEIREGRQGKKIGNVVENGNADTEDDVSDLESSSSSSSKTSNDDAILNPVKTSIPNLADDELLQETILKVFPQSQKGNFNIEDIPEPVTNSLAENSQATDQPSVSNTTLKSLQNELVGYQLLVEKLKRRNQDLLEGSGAAMTQDDKESLEREVSALRGQVALLERNNRIFSDRERTDLKQDLDLANKRCSSFQSQLQAIKASLDYEEVMKVKKQLSDVSKKADEFEAKLQEYEKEETSDSDDSHSSDDSNKPNKYARLLELEEEAEELKNKIEERDEDMKDRDVMIEELQHQLKHIKQQYTDEVEQLEKQNHDKEKELQEEIKELEREVSDKKEMLKLKQANLKNKSNELDDRDDDIEKLQKDIQKKNKEIEQLRWEVESLQRENLSLLKRIDQLKQALSSSNDPALFEAALSPVATFRSPSTGSISTRVRSRSSTPKSSFQDSPDAKRSNRSHDSIGSNYITAFDDHLEPVRSRRAFSFDVDHETPTSALREGIHEAKETVHQMGDVLDTPRMSPSRRMSPVPGSKFASGMSAEYSSPLSSAAHVGGITGIKSKSAPFNNEDKTYQENVKSSKKPKNKEKNKRFKGHSSSSSSSSQEETCDSESDSKSDIVTKKNRGASAASLNPDLSILTIPSKNSTKANEETLVFDSVYPLEVEDGPTRSLASPKARRVKRYTHPQKLKHDKDISDSSTSSSDDSTVSAETTSKSQREDAATFNPSHALNKDLNKTAMHQQKTVSGDLTSSEATTDQRNQSSEAETPVTSDVDTNLKAPFSQGDEPPINTKINDPLSIMFTSNERESTSSLKEAMQPRDSASTMPGSFISDERSALIQEVAKAREEANKWFAEVTEADREKRKLGRRLEALENELVRLKDVENNFDLMKKHQDDVKQVSRDLAAVRTQAEIANRKAEEAREKNALLKAHLLDREEVQNENKELKRSIEKMKRKTEDPNASNSALPLSELQQTVLSPQTGKPSSENTSPPKMVTSPTDKQLNEIKESFEYIASNAKVSQLKRKCLERDQLLAKFVLNLRKKKSDTTADDTSDSCSESVASSPSLAAILAQADRVIRADALDGDTSEADSAVVKLNRSNSDIIGTTARTKDFLSPPRPPSALMRTLSAKSSNSSRSSPTHRIYIAKHDYAPSSRIPSSNNENHLPVTHSLLPDLSLLSGDTVVAIGNPDQREDGKLYQMAEVRGKIGFVPLGHLVAAEQVEGMQAFVQGRGKTDRKRSATSSPEKIVNLYKKLEQAHLMVADKIEKNSKVKPFSPPKQNNGKPKTKKSSFSTPDHDSTTEYASSEASHKPFLQQGRDKKSSRRKREDKPPKYKSTNDPDHLPPSHDASLYNDHLPKRSESNPLTSKMSDNNSDLFGDNKHADSDSSFVPIYGVNNRDDRIRSSTPVQPPSHHRRSSSVPLRRNSSSRSSRSEFSTPGKFMSPSRSTESSPRKERSRSSSRNKDKNRHSNSSFRNTSSSHGPSHIASPHPPTFLVVEKTMGLKSMIIRWTPPLLDMISRSNNLPVIGYEISVDKQRKVQISGAYTNKAILGDLNLTATLTIEVRTVTSVGTLSTPCEVIFTPNLSSSANTTSHSPRPVSQASRSPPSKKSNNRSRDSVIQQKATALYDYDPIVDSPYKTQHDEVALRQGEEVTIVGSPRPDGFCDVQVGSRRGFAPISFLISDCDDSVSSYKPPLQGNDTKKLRHKRRTKGKDRTHRYSSSGSSFRN